MTADDSEERRELAPWWDAAVHSGAGATLSPSSTTATLVKAHGLQTPSKPLGDAVRPKVLHARVLSARRWRRHKIATTSAVTAAIYPSDLLRRRRTTLERSMTTKSTASPQHDSDQRRPRCAATAAPCERVWQLSFSSARRK